jgi:hypothetical protein
MINADQLLCHFIGDYVLQSHWMATEKTKRNLAAVVHAVIYTMVFLSMTNSSLVLFIICTSHFLIDRYRLARYVVYAKNFLSPPSEWLDNCMSWESCKNTGFSSKVPDWLSVWLLIIVDNIIHVIINGVCINYL